MLYRELGKTGVKIPVIGQGTWGMGEDRREDSKAIEAIQLGIEEGLTLIDTAEMYGEGHCEELIGEAIRECRDEVFIVTKFYPFHASYNGVMTAARRSLTHLRTDYIDLYLLHWPSLQFRISETMQALAELVEAGAVRYIGVSNFDVRELEEAVQTAQAHGLNVACNQVLYHLRERGIERRLIPYCEQAGITVMAYSPLGRGEFPSPESRRGRVLAEIAAKYGKTPQQVALNWLTRRNSVVAIPKAIQPEHIRQNARAVGWDLLEEDYRAIDRAFPAPSHDVPLQMI